MKASDYGMPAHKVAEAERLLAEQSGGGRQLAANSPSPSSGRPRKGVALTPRPAAPPSLSGLFTAVCRENSLPNPVAEHVFGAPRKFRFDFAWPDKKVALEVEGGVYTRGAHGSISGILRDIEKYNLAASLGWRVLRVLPAKLYDDATLAILRQTLRYTP